MDRLFDMEVVVGILLDNSHLADPLVFGPKSVPWRMLWKNTCRCGREVFALLPMVGCYNLPHDTDDTYKHQLGGLCQIQVGEKCEKQMAYQFHFQIFFEFLFLKVFMYATLRYS